MNELHHLTLFGVPELIDATGNVVRFRTRKQLALLIYLALEARLQPVSREKLADLFWPNATRRTGAHSLSQGLSEIRSKLGPDAFATPRLHVQLQIALTTDFDLDHQDSSAREIRPPLDGLETCAGRCFADWVEATRDRILTQVSSRLAEELSEARTSGRIATVRERAERLYSVDPYNDAAMQALVAERLSSGDWAGALRLFRRHIGESESELGRSPSAKVLATLRRFERGFLRDTKVEDANSAEPPDVEPRPEAFIGRESEMARLEALSHEVRGGRYRSCALRGTDGIGKTTVLRRFTASLASDSVPAYLVTCQKIGQSIPFAAVSDLLEQMSRDPSLSGTDAMWLAEASRVAPGIKAAYPGIPDPPITPPETVRVRLGEAIKRMLEAVADGRPVILAFDDLHYMDPASREVLHMLARRLDGTPTILLAAVRCSETDLARGSSESIDAVLWQETIDLHPFDNRCAAELISALSKSDEPVNEAVSHKIVELAEGSPLLTEMLVSDWHKNGVNSLVMVNISGEEDNVNWCPPDTMRSAFARQYDGLSKCAQRLVHLLATAGRRLSIQDGCRLLAVPSETVGAAVFELIERSIASLEGNALGFKNDLHRAFVYSTLPKETRKYQHAHLAQHLSVAKDQSEFQHALEASHHFLKAGWIDEATELACVGAERAITWGAPKEAEKALEAVIAVDPKSASTPLYLFLARALTALGKYQDALNALAAWQPTIPTQNEAALAATIRVEALHRGRLEDDETIKQALDLAMNLTEESGVDSLFVSTLQLSAEWASETGDSQALDSVRARTQRIGQSSSHTTTKALARLSQGYCLLVAGDAHQAEIEFRKCIKTLCELHLDPELRQVHNGIGIACYCLGAMDRSALAFESAIDLATGIGDSVAAATSWSNLGAVHEDLGNFDKTHECYERALLLGETATNPRRAVEFHLNAAGLELITGELTDARRSTDIARRWADESQLWWLTADVMLAEADTCLADRRPDMAWSLLKEAQRAMLGRVYALSNRGRYERLRRHHAFVTHGLPAMLKLSEAEDLKRLCMQLTGRLEIRAFEDWARTQVNTTHHSENSPYDELEARGLFGVLRRMDVLGYSTS